MTPETRSGRGDALVGSMLERRYRVDALIARGGMSTVYRGLDTRLHRPVAIKVMDSRYSGDRSFTDRFNREAQAAASLHHPNVVAVYDQGVDHEINGDLVYLVMQLVQGCTLRDLLREHGPLPVPMAFSVLEPILAALAAAHQTGMVHRDIKPENVLIGLDGSVMVADFGLVRAAASAGATSGSVILGTVAYLSPEQVTTGAADAATDVYAAGIVLHEMLTGSPPYVGDTALSVAYRHVNEDVSAPGERAPGIPPAVDDLALRATRRTANERPPNAAAFLEQVQRVRSDLGISLVPVPVPPDAQNTAEIEFDDGPPTERMAPAQEHQTGGPRGTRAIRRPEPETDRTQDLPAVQATGPTEDDRRRGKRGGGKFALGILAVLVLAGLLGAAAWWLGTAPEVEVPGVVGRSEPVAVQVIERAGLAPNITREFHDTAPAGMVISSSPNQGAKAGPGDEVDLVISLGRPKVPEITAGTSVDDAERMLRDAMLKPHRDSASDDYHMTVPEGMVIAVNPAPGTPVTIGGEVSISVSKGPPPVPVPDVRGMSTEDAFEALREAGFEPFDAGQRFDGNVDKGHVISTDPAPGTEVRLYGKPRVGVVVSNAVTVPNLNGMSVADAQQQLATLGLRLEARSLLGSGNYILGQFPLPGSKAQPGQTVYVNAF